MPAKDNWTTPYAGVEEGLNYWDAGNGVKVYDVRHIIPQTYAEGIADKIGYAIHHATGVYNGTSIASDIAYIKNIDTFHKSAPPAGRGWPGFGYHRMINPHTGRVYLVASSATVRAHVENLNHLWIGYCIMGGWVVRPPEAGMKALVAATQWETNQRMQEMQIRPHKFFQPTNECPGNWATVDTWAGVTILPQAAPPAQPAPAPAPAIDKEAILKELNAIRTSIQRIEDRL